MIKATASQSPQSKANANRVAQQPSSQRVTLEPPNAILFEDRRPEAVAQRALQALANNSPQVRQVRAIQDMANESLQMQNQSRVMPTSQAKGVAINDEAELQKEPDVKRGCGQEIVDLPQPKKSIPTDNSSSVSRRGIVQRWILKGGTRTKTRENTYQKFPTTQLTSGPLGLTQAELPYARPYFDKATYYTVSQVIRNARKDYQKVNRGRRVKPKNSGNRLQDMNAVIDYYEDIGEDTTRLHDKFVNRQHDSAYNEVLKLVPLTDKDIESVKPIKFVSFMNQEHVPDMVRTSSMIGDISQSMETANTGTQGFVSSSKGSMFEQWVAKHVIVNSGKVHINQQTGMSQARDSDGYNKSNKTIYDAKNYSKKMPKSTNNNQHSDYQTIVDNGYRGSNGEVITNVCYIFPDVQSAQLNVHLKDTHIQVAYPAKKSNSLTFV